MCNKAGNNELASVKALMNMSLNVLIADTFAVDIKNINNALRLRSDLGMSPAEESELHNGISEYFDGLNVEMKHILTIGDLHKMVVDHEFKNIPEFYLN